MAEENHSGYQDLFKVMCPGCLLDAPGLSEEYLHATKAEETCYRSPLYYVEARCGRFYFLAQTTRRTFSQGAPLTSLSAIASAFRGYRKVVVRRLKWYQWPGLVIQFSAQRTRTWFRHRLHRFLFQSQAR